MDLAIGSATLELDAPVTGQKIIDAVKKIAQAPHSRVIEKSSTVPGAVVVGQSSGYHTQRFIIGPAGDGTSEDDFAIHPTKSYNKVRICPHNWPDNTFTVAHNRSAYDSAIIGMLEALGGELLDV